PFRPRNFPGWRISMAGPAWRPAHTHAPPTTITARTTRKTRNFITARILRIIARGSTIGVVYISAIRVRYFPAPRGSMLKKLLVVVAFLAPILLISVLDQTSLDAQSPASVVISEFRTRGPAVVLNSSTNSS